MHSRDHQKKFRGWLPTYEASKEKNYLSIQIAEPCQGLADIMRCCFFCQF